MPVGSDTTADGITERPDYAYDAPASFFEEGAVPTGDRVYIPEGLVADPNFDNRPAIQAAIDKAAEAGGGIVYIPPGVYGIDGDPDGSGGVLVKDNVFLKGAGMGETVLRIVDHVGELITGIVRSPFGVPTDNWGVSDISLDGNKANNDPVLEHVDGFFCGGIPGETITDHDVTLLRVEIYGCSGYGFDPHERTERLLIDSCVAHHNHKDGFVADFIIDGEYRNNLAYENDRHGFNLTTTSNDFLLHNNIARDNGSTGIVVQRGGFDIPVPYNIVIRDNVLTGNGREGILIQMGENILIENNTITDSGRAGVRILGASHVTVRDNLVTGSSQEANDGFPDVHISQYDDLAGPGKRIYAAHWNLIENNQLISDALVSTSYGVEESAGDVGDNVVRGNDIQGQFRGLYKYFSYTTTVHQRGTNHNEGIIGNGLNDRFLAAGGDDRLKGNDGNDILNGGEGADTMAGGVGHDLFKVDNIGDKVSEKDDEGFDRVHSSVTFTLGKNIELLRLIGRDQIDGTGNDAGNIIFGNRVANTLTGKKGDDILFGGGGKDTLLGGAGDDKLRGGSGDDRMEGGKGDDIYVVDSAGDVVFEKPNEGRDAVFSSISYVLDATIEDLRLIGAGDIDGTGTERANWLHGNNGSNTFLGHGGNDQIEGRGGDDRLFGEDGDDLLDGGAGADRMRGGLGNDGYVISEAGDIAIELAGGGYDAVYSSISHQLGADFEALYLIGDAEEGQGNFQDNAIFGSDAANKLSGMDGNDVIYGNGGIDIITGGAGTDVMAGGAGADVFAFNSAADIAQDVLVDFSHVEGDTIDFSGFDAGVADGQQHLLFIGANAFTGAAGELRFEAEDGGVALLGDLNGDGAADFAIHVRGVDEILAGDTLV